MSNLAFSFKHPTTIQVTGPTRCGKTRLVLTILKRRLIEPFPTRIIWVYREWQPDYDEARALYPHIEFEEGWNDDLYDRLRVDETNLLILDDQMDDAGNSKTLKDLFTVGAHHRNSTILYLIQNMFDQGKSQRSVSLNSHYTVVFKNPRDASQFRTLAHRMCPGDAQWLLDAFSDATGRRYGYLVLDHHPESTDEERVLSNIVPDEGEHLSYYTKRRRV